jgi:hypothetical protein
MLDDRSGSALIITLAVLTMIAFMGTTIVMNSLGDRTISRYSRDATDALAAAETGLALAVSALKQTNAPMGDFDSDGHPDFRIQGTLPWGGSYDVIAEAGEIRGSDAISPYRAKGFTIISEGSVRGARRRVKAELVKESFLKFARFVASTGTGYGCRDDVEAELYVGGNLNIATCSTEERVRFLEHVWVTGQVNNQAGGDFMQGYTEFAPEIDLQNSVDFDEIADVARGTAAESACEFIGNRGFFLDPPSWDPIGITATGGELDLSLFDFYDTTTVPGDTTITYNGFSCINTGTGLAMKLSEFNGVLFFEDDAHVRGTANGVSGRSLSIYARDDVYVEGDIITGTTGFDPITRAPTGAGDPVNIGLIGQYYVYLGDVPQIIQVDAAIMAVRRNWRARNPSLAAHPPVLVGPVDLDMDGIAGETPVNHDPDPGTGWDEMNLTADHWVLNLNGPLITYDGASAVPWSSGTVEAAASGPTWKYRYDHDVREFPPPCFPDPLNYWKQVTWSEILDGDNPIEALLPS